MLMKLWTHLVITVEQKDALNFFILIENLVIEGVYLDFAQAVLPSHGLEEKISERLLQNLQLALDEYHRDALLLSLMVVLIENLELQFATETSLARARWPVNKHDTFLR